MESTLRAHSNSHVSIVVAEGKVTPEDLHAALDQVIRHMASMSGCRNCGLNGFDLSFLRGDPALSQLAQIPNIQAGVAVRG